MTKLAYPNRINDHETVLTFRKIMDTVNGQQEDIDANSKALAALGTPLTLAQIQKALQLGGSNPLNITGLPPFQSGATISVGTHAQRLITPATVGGLFWETDRTVLYVGILVSAAGVWHYGAGQMVSAIASRPTDLGTNDTGFAFVGNDTVTEYEWTGTGWNTIGGLFQIIQNSTSAGNTDIFIIQHLLNNLAGANGMAASFLTQLVDSAKATVDGSRIETVTIDATAGAFLTALVFQLRPAGSPLTEIMRVHGDGNVGIGTPTPQTTLDILPQGGAPRIYLGALGGSFSGLGIDTGSAGMTAATFVLVGDGTNIVINRNTGGNISFREDNGADQMTIASGGIVLIPGILGVGFGSPFTIDTSGNVAANSLSLVIPLAVLQGGTGSTTAAGARTNLGAAASTGVGGHTVPLAKLTIAGTNGSITYNADGCITGSVDPT